MDEFRPTNKSLLKGVEDWPHFEQDMEAVFRVQKTWEVVIGKKKRPTLPTLPIPPESQLSTSREKLPEHTHQQIKKYEEALEDWEEKNSSAIGALILRCGVTPRSYIRKIGLVSVAWEKLTQVYGVSSITSIDATMGALTRLKSTSFNTIQDYAAEFKNYEDKLSLLDAPIPPVLLAALFRNGLEESLAPYVFNLVQQCKTSGSMLDIDTMVAALSEKQVRINDSENNNKALAAQFGKQDKAKRPPRSPAGSRPHSRNPPTDRKNEKDNRKTCPHCHKLHRKENCWYTNPINHQRTKHIRNKFHFVREMVSETGPLTLQYSNTADMVAGGMTKALAPNDFRPFRDKLGLATSVIGGELGQ